MLCTNGGEISDAQRAMLADRGVQIREDVVDRLEGKGTALARIVFKDAGYLERTTYCTPFYLPANCFEAAVRRLVMVILIGLLTWWADGAV
ncbi:hypothetical protein AB0392_51000 [Nonomuraea angiospora]|uniref:hypothetical protein n=1 Tax=Nonomuraea angiospora TaxID=46172 RepID=UPI00344BA474